MTVIQIPPGQSAPTLPRVVTPWEVATMLRRAGMPLQYIPLMVAVAGVESTYNVTASNGTHFGLFQIAGTKGFDNARLASDPQYNVDAAVQVWKAGGSGTAGISNGWLKWEPPGAAQAKVASVGIPALDQSRKNVPDSQLPQWTVHSDDTSTLHGAASDLGAGGVYTGVQDVAGGAGSLLETLGQLSTWERAGEVVGGFILLVTGVVLLVRQVSSGGGMPSVIPV